MGLGLGGMGLGMASPETLSSASNARRWQSEHRPLMTNSRNSSSPLKSNSSTEVIWQALLSTLELKQGHEFAGGICPAWIYSMA